LEAQNEELLTSKQDVSIKLTNLQKDFDEAKENYQATLNARERKIE